MWFRYTLAQSGVFILKVGRKKEAVGRRRRRRSE